jgi:hypothetical protein
MDLPMSSCHSSSFPGCKTFAWRQLLQWPAIRYAFSEANRARRRVRPEFSFIALLVRDKHRETPWASPSCQMEQEKGENLCRTHMLITRVRVDAVSFADRPDLLDLHGFLDLEDRSYRFSGRVYSDVPEGPGRIVNVQTQVWDEFFSVCVRGMLD